MISLAVLINVTSVSVKFLLLIAWMTGNNGNLFTVLNNLLSKVYAVVTILCVLSIPEVPL